MASFLVRIFREQTDYLAVVDGWGTVRSPTLRGVREEAKRLVREIVDGAFPPRTRIEQDERRIATSPTCVSAVPRGAGSYPADSGSSRAKHLRGPALHGGRS